MGLKQAVTLLPKFANKKMKLYPLIIKHFDDTATSHDFIELWNSTELPQNTRCYGVYFNYQNNGKAYDFAIASEMENEHTPIVIDDDLVWYEKFSTKCELLADTWQDIIRKGKQGLLKRALTVDFEKYYPDGKVEVYIALQPHC